MMMMNTPFKAIWGCNRDHIFREGVPERYNINKKRESLCYSGSKGFKRWSGIGKARGRVGVRGRNMRWNTGTVIKYLVAEFQLL